MLGRRCAVGAAQYEADLDTGGSLSYPLPG